MPIEFNSSENVIATSEIQSFSQKKEVTQVAEEQEQLTLDSNSSIYGLSSAEYSDPNNIVVTIANTSAPLVVLFGPPACGKTMTLVRLTRFLKEEGYVVSPIRTFRPSIDTHYADLCQNFDKMINNNNAAHSTDLISFMLIEVLKDGRPICQILEAPGEYYFKPEEPQRPFPVYVNKIISSTNRKIWAVMVEPDWYDFEDRLNYVNRVASLKRVMRPSDSVLFVYNKIDKTNFVRSVGNINTQEAIKNIKYLYPGIFTPFENQNPITKWFKQYNCDFIPFQTGTYTTSTTGLTYVDGPREYCVKLWSKLMNKIKG